MSVGQKEAALYVKKDFGLHPNEFVTWKTLDMTGCIGCFTCHDRFLFCSCRSELSPVLTRDVMTDCKLYTFTMETWIFLTWYTNKNTKRSVFMGRLMNGRFKSVFKENCPRSQFWKMFLVGLNKQPNNIELTSAVA